MGVTGYSGVNYVGIARTYFDYLKPDLIILCIDQSDFNDDVNKLNNIGYSFDDKGYPYKVKKKEALSQTIKKENYIDKVDNLKNLLLLESATFNYLIFLRNKIKSYRYKQSLKKVLERNYETISYENLSLLDKNDLKRINISGDNIFYNLEDSKKKYWLTLKSLEFVKKKTEDINSTLVLFSHPYAWYVDPKQSKYYQVRNYGKI